MRKILALSIVSLFLFGYAQANPLAPSIPIVVPSSEATPNFCTAVAAANRTGFMVVWVTSPDDYELDSTVYASFTSDQGTSWTTPYAIDNTVSAYPYAAANDAGFLVAWTGADPGWSSGSPVSAFYNSASDMWSSPEAIDASIGSQVPVSVGASSSGFVTSWAAVSSSALYTNVSANGLVWQNSSTQITSVFETEIPACCAKGDTFLLAWNDVDSSPGNIYVSTTSDSGAIWSEPATAVANVTNREDQGVGCFANSSGYLLVYQDASGDFWSVFSPDAASWTLPRAIPTPTDVSSGYSYLPAVGGTDAGFVVAWMDVDYNAYASFSADNGSTWSAAVQITNDGSLYQNPNFSSLTVAAYGDQCMFAWQNQSSQAVVSFSSFPSPSSHKANRTLNKQVTPNSPGIQLN